jgi:hypothetical protein
MIGQTVSQYKIVEKLGEVPIRLDLTSGAKLSPSAELRISRPMDSAASGIQKADPPIGGSRRKNI